MNWLKDLCLVSCSYMDTEQYEEAVRDYEKVYQTEKTKGGGRADITTSHIGTFGLVLSCHFRDIT